MQNKTLILLAIVILGCLSTLTNTQHHFGSHSARKAHIPYNKKIAVNKDELLLKEEVQWASIESTQGQYNWTASDIALKSSE